MKNGYEKRFNKGDIVYRQKGNDHIVEVGMVDEQFSDAVCIDLLDAKEMLLVNGIPIDKFESESKYKKLPKGWTYSTKLYELSYAKSDTETPMIEFTDPANIKKLYDMGCLVKKSTKFHGVIDVEITGEGYRVVKKYPQWEHVITNVSIRPDKVYFTYTEAENEVNEYLNELKYQASLTDADWSIHQIDKTLAYYKNISDIPQDIIDKYHNWLCRMKDIEFLEVRVYGNNIQWKYEPNKKWNYIELADVMRC